MDTNVYIRYLKLYQQFVFTLLVGVATTRILQSQYSFFKRVTENLNTNKLVSQQPFIILTLQRYDNILNYQIFYNFFLAFSNNKRFIFISGQMPCTCKWLIFAFWLNQNTISLTKYLFYFTLWYVGCNSPILKKLYKYNDFYYIGNIY